MGGERDIKYDLKLWLRIWTMLTLHNKWDSKHFWIPCFLREMDFESLLKGGLILLDIRKLPEAKMLMI